MSVYCREGRNGRKIWYIDYYFLGRRKREKVGPSKKLAEKAMAKREVQIAEGRFFDIKARSRMKFKERAKNVIGAFAAARGGRAAGKRALLIDDVVTTGTTASECARVLKEAGAAEVHVFTLARRDWH